MPRTSTFVILNGAAAVLFLRLRSEGSAFCFRTQLPWNRFRLSKGQPDSSNGWPFVSEETLSLCLDIAEGSKAGIEFDEKDT